MFTVLASIWLLHVAALISPGANVLLVSQLAAAGHTRGAYFAALGVTLGAAMWATAAVLGINVLFAAFPQLRLALQIAGGLYLLYVASRLWRAGAPSTSTAVEAMTVRSALRLGLLTNITNPKSALFFGSVFAASFPADPSALLQVTAVAMVIANALCWHLLLAFLFSRARVRATYSHGKGFLGRIAAALVGTLGMGLLWSTVREARS